MRSGRTVASARQALSRNKKAYDLFSVCKHWQSMLNDSSHLQRRLFLKPTIKTQLEKGKAPKLRDRQEIDSNSMVIVCPPMLMVTNPIIARPLVHPELLQTSPKRYLLMLHPYIRQYMAWVISCDLKNQFPEDSSPEVIG
jgi:hypothetical protein